MENLCAPKQFSKCKRPEDGTNKDGGEENEK